MILMKDKNKKTESQRDNDLIPSSSCNVTAMINASASCGHIFPKGKHKQAEDNLLEFILSDKECERLWLIENPKRNIPMNQIHAVLALGFNRWMGKEIAKFTTKAKFSAIYEWLRNGNTGMTSGMFPKTNGHCVAVVGMEIRENDYEPVSLIIKDSWGDYHTDYRNTNGHNIKMSIEDAKKILSGGKDEKWFHFITKA